MPDISSISLVIEETNEAGYDGVKITLRAEITDDLSGFDTLGIRYEASDGPGQWLHVHSGNLVAGDSGNDVYESVLYLPEYSLNLKTGRSLRRT